MVVELQLGASYKVATAKKSSNGFWTRPIEFFRRMTTFGHPANTAAGAGDQSFGVITPPFNNPTSNGNSNGFPQTATAEAGGVSNKHRSVKDLRRRGIPWILGACAAVIILLTILLSYFLYKDFYSTTHNNNSLADSCGSKSHSQKHGREDWPPLDPRTSLVRFSKAAVVSDNGLCSEIGRTILLRGGNAVDAGIATVACIGALNSHSSGLGGGFLMTIYNRFYGKCTTLDAREVAPQSVNSTTFDANPKDSYKGYKSIAVPGELHGYWTAYKRYGSGRIAWQDLLMPTVHLLTNGYPTTKLMEYNLQVRQEEIMAEPSMRNFFVNNQTNELYKEGEVIKNPQLAETFRKLAVSPDPVRHFYGGELGKQISDEIGESEGYVTKRDMELYRTVVDESPLVNDHFTGSEKNPLAVCGAKPSSGFAVTQLILAVMSKFYPIGSDSEIPYKSVEFYHRFIETQKFAFAQRTLLGDPKFVKDANAIAENMTKQEFIDSIYHKIKHNSLNFEEYGGDFTKASEHHGTSHVSVVDADGNAVSLTSSINNVFGAAVRSERLGIVWNNQMDDFSIKGSLNFFQFEPSEANYIAPGKRPMSSMSPMIVYNKNTKQVKASVGASGGSKINSALAQVLLQTMSFNHTIKEAIDMPRLHNQYTPYKTEFEKEIPPFILDGLRHRHQNLTQMIFPFATVQAIVRNDESGMLEANSDHRRSIYMYPTGY
ncbi:gamma-glutamyltranspeptidase domain-containing protein [Ditylenchus destructor]|uniref:Gamma-glutamyltranspeptidase domain-containing protein n=1 Tax=Ditylenchus destructor TaxID=166010 RepID=A0AAD4R010_9BILA|nr:gamma-glutamyltranspeptidase domain-containing protein [Ditylenchus destructor]